MDNKSSNLYILIAGVALILVSLLAWALQDPISGVSLWGYIALGIGVISLAFGIWE
ncbi:MAG: hypothetical protein HN400_01160, partial [Nitrospinaceae bacterium]|nr:hypothetical protein [Nitrospinaceae bacterium]